MTPGTRIFRLMENGSIIDYGPLDRIEHVTRRFGEKWENYVKDVHFFAAEVRLAAMDAPEIDYGWREGDLWRVLGPQAEVWLETLNEDEAREFFAQAMEGSALVRNWTRSGTQWRTVE